MFLHMVLNLDNEQRETKVHSMVAALGMTPEAMNF
ncbi:hypothetical protein BVRB_6g134630 [Beta vulgaris subsp. vulgaris]|nr:hypothetical protein BVRB_6g134630 [Beta vulgaris subsp. vulgaris]